MRTPIDRAQQRFGRLLIISEAARDKPSWICKCDCGSETIIGSYRFSATRPPQSCGCLQKEKARLQGLATAKDRSGEKTGRLLILRKEGRRGGRTAYLCRCDCGKEIVSRGSDLHPGRTQSCGCLHKDKLVEFNRSEKKMKHGHARNHHPTPTWNSWKSMHNRCSLPSMSNYHLYGGRGIKVCKKWTGKSGYVAFLADMGERPDGTTLDRKNNDGNYTPRNCRWSTASEQSANRRATPERLAMIRENLKGGRRHWPRHKT